MNNLFAIFIGGGLGSLARFGVSSLVALNFKTGFPLATLIANALSCIVLGASVGIFKDKLLAHDLLRGLILIGFCGGFSTFSTFSYETLELIKSGQYFYAVGNILISIALCAFIIFILSKNQT